MTLLHQNLGLPFELYVSMLIHHYTVNFSNNVARVPGEHTIADVSVVEISKTFCDFFLFFLFYFDTGLYSTV